MGSNRREPGGTHPGVASPPGETPLSAHTGAAGQPSSALEGEIDGDGAEAPGERQSGSEHGGVEAEEVRDKRGHPRAAIELKVEYKKLNAFFYDYTRNISKGGTFIKTPRPLEVGTEFTFKLSVPRLNDPLVLKGCVRWIVEEAEAGSDPSRPEPGMGIQFLYRDDEERGAVDRVVEALIVQELGERAYAKLMGRAPSTLNLTAGSRPSDT